MILIEENGTIDYEFEYDEDEYREVAEIIYQDHEDIVEELLENDLEVSGEIILNYWGCDIPIELSDYQENLIEIALEDKDKKEKVQEILNRA